MTSFGDGKTYVNFCKVKIAEEDEKTFSLFAAYCICLINGKSQSMK